MKKTMRCLNVVLALLLLTGSMLWAGGQQGTEKSREGIAEEVTLSFFFPGDIKEDTQLVWDKVSEVTKDTVNAKYDITFVPWADYPDKIQLLVASGDNFDSCFDADWFNFPKLINKGAYLALTELMPKHAPTMYSIYKQKGMLEPCSVGGELYGIPWTIAKTSRPVMYYRKDLLHDIGLEGKTDFSTLQDLEEYLYAFKATYPEYYPIQWTRWNDNPILWSLYPRYEMDRWDFHYFTIDLNDPDSKVIPLEQTEIFRETVRTIRKWAEDGIISRDMINNPVDTLFEDGEFISGLHIYEGGLTWQPTVNPVAERGYGVMYPEGKYRYDSPMNNAMVINKNAANPERTLIFLEQLTTRQDVYDLVIYGMKDVHYIIKDGAMELAPGEDPAVTKYLNWSGQWGLWRADRRRPDNLYTQEVLDKIDEFHKMPTTIVSPISGFIPDTEPIKTELIQRDAVYEELGKLLIFGMVEDVDSALNEYIQKQKAANLDKIVAELQKQVDAFIGK